MGISTNSIIHYTQTYEALTGILDEGFRVKYCLEKLRLYSTNSNAAHPLVCFCDIPLSESNRHFNAYGHYGIGLSKSWALKNEINPVIYIDSGSLFAQSIENLVVERRRNNTNLTDEQKQLILKIKSYAKNYQGNLRRGSKVIRNYRFYDEREWRLVPRGETIKNARVSISGKKYESMRDEYNARISDCRIKFSASDISYIIVHRTEEIPKMISFLKRIYTSRYDQDQLDILFSKLCSTDQILADF